MIKYNTQNLIDHATKQELVQLVRHLIGLYEFTNMSPNMKRMNVKLQDDSFQAVIKIIGRVNERANNEDNLQEKKASNK